MKRGVRHPFWFAYRMYQKSVLVGIGHFGTHGNLGRDFRISATTVSFMDEQETVPPDYQSARRREEVRYS